MTKWRNWGGNVVGRPASVKSPKTTEEIAAAVREAADKGTTVRMVGSRHSFTDTAASEGIELHPDQFKKVREVDVEGGTITVDAGLNLDPLCHVLADNGLALTNMGDIRTQTLSGALQTSTHGTGRDSGTFGAMTREIELVTGTGEIVTVNEQNDPDLFACIRAGSNGAFGIVTGVKIAVEPAFRLKAFEGASTFDECVNNFDQWTAEHDHCEFFWFPHTEGCQVKRNDRTYDEAQPFGKFKQWWEYEFMENKLYGTVCKMGRSAPRAIPFLNKTAVKLMSDREVLDDSWKVFTSERDVRFVEMEYAMPREALLPTLKEARKIIEDGPWYIQFPIEIRSVPSDEPWLSTAHGRDTGYIACHATAFTDRSWFAPLEELFKANGGRPHWGKMNTRTADDLRPVYPRWDDAMKVRDRVDPNRVFLNNYTRRVFGP